MAVTRPRLQRLHEQALYACLKWRFGFAWWHVTAPYSGRPYKRVVTDVAAEMRPRKVAEIGCGLGNIISRVSATTRFGVDIDAKVIAAARYLSRGKVNFMVGSAEALISDVVGHLDLVIAVNWLHAISPEEVREQLRPLIQAKAFTYFIADQLIAPPIGRWSHRLDKIYAPEFTLLQSVDVPTGERRIHVYRHS
jgi:SAM-dependent methyltransferase